MNEKMYTIVSLTGENVDVPLANRSFTTRAELQKYIEDNNLHGSYETKHHVHNGVYGDAWEYDGETRF